MAVRHMSTLPTMRFTLPNGGVNGDLRFGMRGVPLEQPLFWR